MQDDIATQVAAALNDRISGMRAPDAAAAPTRDIEAYLAWLRGRTLTGRYTAAKADAAAAEFEQAIALDPELRGCLRRALRRAHAVRRPALRGHRCSAPTQPPAARASAGPRPAFRGRAVRTGDVGRPRRRHARSDLPRGRAPGSGQQPRAHFVRGVPARHCLLGNPRQGARIGTFRAVPKSADAGGDARRRSWRRGDTAARARRRDRSPRGARALPTDRLRRSRPGGGRGAAGGAAGHRSRLLSGAAAPRQVSLDVPRKSVAGHRAHRTRDRGGPAKSVCTPDGRGALP